MPFSTSLKLAFKALYTNKVRSLLSILGIVIGISSVIILMAAGVGAQNYILDQVQSFGSNRVTIFPGTPDEESGGFSPSFAGITITTLTYDDSTALKNNPSGPNIANTTAIVGSQGTITSPFDERIIQFQGTTPSYFTISNTKIEQGRNFEERDLESLSRVAIIGPNIAETLFPNSDALNQNIKINNIIFRIIGISEAKGIGQFGINYDEIVFIPITTAQKLILGITHVSNIIITSDNEANIDLAAEQAKIILRDRHKLAENDKNDFSIINSKDALAIVNNVTNALSLFLTAIAAISLLVGGIGIMNIMLVSVTERTKEIGLRKAIGATRSDILTQFITESVIITLFGGIVGILIGLSVATLITLLTDLKTYVTINSILLAFGVSSIAGIVFGFYPANQASKMNPIDAIRFQ